MSAIMKAQASLIKSLAETMSPGLADDKVRVAAAFAESAHSYDAVAGLQRQVGAKLMAKAAARLAGNRLSNGYKILDLGSGTGYFSEQFVKQWPIEIISLDIAHGMLRYARQHHTLLQQQSFLCADAEKLPVAENSVNMVFSNFVLQWCDDLESVFQQIKKILQPGGLFLFSLPVDGTLKELKSSWQEVDQYQHVNDFHSFKSVQAIARNVFSKANKTSLYCEDFLLYYQQMSELTKELKALGANQVKASHHSNNKSKALMGRHSLQKLLAAYDQFRNQQGLLPATYKVAYGLIEVDN